MVKFIQINQVSKIQDYKAINCSYESIRGRPFDVSDKQDIEYFKNKGTRFKELGLVESVIKKTFVLPDVKEELFNYLKDIKGLNNADRKVISEYYEQIDILKKRLEDGMEVECEISNNKKTILKNHINKQLYEDDEE